MSKQKKRKSDPLPEHLRITPERRKKIDEQQLRLREAAIARGRLTPEARRVQLGVVHEISARAEVEMLSAELRDDSRNAEKKARLEQASARLAEALAQQGRYDEAAEVETDKFRKAHYTAMWEAVWREDEETCPCEPFVDGEMSLTHDHVAEEVISAKHDGKLMPAVRCNKCGFVNVRPLTHELRELERVREQASALIHGRDARSLKREAKELLADLRDQKVLTR